MNPAVQSAIVSGVVGLLIWYGSNRSNRRALAATNALEHRRVNSEGKAVDLTVLKASIDDLKERLERVEGDREHEREQRRLSNGYARTLAQVLRDHNMPVPPPPAGLDLP